MTEEETICAPATPAGNGAIAIIRISGNKAFEIAGRIIELNGNKKISDLQGYTLHFGKILDQGKILDEVIVTLFRAPKSYTGENVIEISCHGSVYIQQRILELLIGHGIRLARPGEFTQRAFLNGKIDLTQAEAVADLIASSTETMHKVAVRQLRGGVSDEISNLRSNLLQLISLLELELDFSEEDVEFANRSELNKISGDVITLLNKLKDSFKYGNAVKSGIPVSIIGQPNVGKSTLLNALLNEERAIVSEIPGTTRDALEDTINLDGYIFRFIDTAGLRSTKDIVESIGIRKTMEKIEQSEIVLFLFDINENIKHIREQLEGLSKNFENKKVLVIINKTDLLDEKYSDTRFERIKDVCPYPIIRISAKRRLNLDTLKNHLIEISEISLAGEYDTLLTSSRHHASIVQVIEAMIRVQEGIENKLQSDLIAMDLRQAIHYLGEITGEITNDEVLGNIFKNFCIGK